MNDGMRPLELTDRVKVFMLNDRFWHGQKGTLEQIERKHHNGHTMTLYTVRMDMGQRIKVERKSLIPLDYDNVNKDAEVLPEYVPAIPEPKDGDHISNHKGHEIVTAQAGNESYKYCRTCKIEVSEGGRIMRGHNATVSIGGKEIGKFDDINITTDPIAGQDLDDIAALYGMTRDFQEGDTLFRQRVLKKANGK